MKPGNLLLLVLACTFFLPFPISAQQGDTTSDAPYLMAFSVDPAPHFVIERADGTDSRVFADELMAYDANAVSGPGWSPSGQWFAWLSGSFYNETNTGYYPFVISADGQTRLTALDDMNRVDLAWSPNDDILLVAGLVNPPEIFANPETHLIETINESDTLTMRIGLFDPAADAFIQVQEMPAPFPRQNLLDVDFQLGWTRDGTRGLVLARGYDSNTDTTTVYIYSIGLEGAFEITDFDPASFVWDYWSASLSPYGDFASFSSPTTLQITDPVEGVSEVTIPTTTDILNSWWSGDGEQLLVHSQQAYPESSTASPDPSLWVWSRASNSITPLFDGTAVEGHTELKMVTPAPDFNGVYYVVGTNAGDTAYYARMDGAQTLELGEASPTAYPVFNTTGQIAFGAEQNYGEISYVVEDVSGDAPVQRRSFVAADYSTPILTSGGATVGFISSEIHFIDLASGDALVLSPDSRRYFASYGGEMELDSNEEWVLLWEEALVAGGGYRRYTSVVNADGTVQRPLGFCIEPTRRCLEWLPAQVDPTTLAPGADNRLPTPLVTIPIGYWMGDLIWSPDADQIAVGTEWRGEGETVPFSVFRIDSGEQGATFNEVSWEQTIGWDDGAAMIIPREVDPRDTDPRTLAVSTDGSLAAQIRLTDEYWLDIVDADGSPPVSLLNIVVDFRPSASFSPDGRYLAVSSAANDVSILDVQTGEVVGGLPLIHSLAIAFSPDGTQLAVAQGTTLQIYNVADLLSANP